MTIRKKSDKEIRWEIEWFVDYAQNIWKISKAKGDEIFSILSQNKNSIKDKNDIKNYMSSVLSSDEFDKLYDEYVKYYWDAWKYIKDFFEKNKFFPEWYDFLISNLFYFLYEDDRDSVDSFIKELNDMSQDDIIKWRDAIKNNINTIKNTLHNKKDFRKLNRWLIFHSDPEELKENINILKDCWIHLDNIDDINKYANVITLDNYDKTAPNLHVLIEELNISNPEDLVCLWEIIKFWDTDKIRTNIPALIEIWISNSKDLKILKDIIYNWTPDKIKSNISALMKLWINDIDKLSDLKYFITNWNWEIINELNKAWVNIDAGNINIIRDIITNWVSGNITALKELGIELDIDNINKVGWVITEGIPENITALKDLWFNNHSINQFDWFIRKGKLENLKFLQELWLINSVDDINDTCCNFVVNWKLENIKALKDIWIDVDASNFFKLKTLIINGVSDNIKLLNDMWLNKDSFSDFEIYQNIISYWKIENMTILRDLWLKFWPNLDEYSLAKIFIKSKTDNIKTLKERWIFWDNGEENLKNIMELLDILTDWNNKNIEMILDCLEAENDINKKINILSNLKAIILCANPENLQIILWLFNNELNDENINILINLKDIIYWVVSTNLQTILWLFNNELNNDNINEIIQLKDFLSNANSEILKSIITFLSNSWSNNISTKTLVNELHKYEKLFYYTWRFPYQSLTNSEIKEDNHLGYIPYMNKIVNLNMDDNEISMIISDILKLSFSEIDNYLSNINEFCIKKKHSYSDFLKCFDWESINKNLAIFLDKWFEIPSNADKDDMWILNNSINLIYPNQNIKFNEKETQKILSFIDCIWWVNKWYTILILIIEKMVKDWVDSNIFNKILCNKLNNYIKIINQYPEDKIPEWLKVSVWMEIEMTWLFANRYKNTTWNDYRDIVNKITKDAKIWQGRDWIHEFATKPSTNPMVTLLEIHLLQELNLLDINDMQKLSWNPEFNLLAKDDEWRKFYEKPKIAEHKTKKWTWYHLNIWSDSDIWINENIDFIQNLCTILPWSGISNWDNVSQINRYANANSKSSKFSVFENWEWKKYIELRTYSMDDVELFEKNVLFNTYAVIWNQAQKKVSDINSSKIIELKDNNEIKDSKNLMAYLENNNLFMGNQDIKSKKIATEFIWMQICVLRSIDNYNHNFIDDELFWKDLIENLSESRKNYFLDLLLSDKKETIWFVDTWHSSMIVKNYTNLKEKFDAQEYIQNNEPFTDEDTKAILNGLWNTVDEKWIPYVTTRLNKQVLWAKLCEWVTDTQELEDKINSKMSNIDRIKSYLKENDQNLKIDREYLYNYFKEKMSLSQFNPYHAINTDYVNKIINLNNFFLKKDDTNARGVLQYTKYNWKEEADISKLSIFETWYMRKWYNYYQWWSEDMLIHSAQRIALSYMENVNNILNSEDDGKHNNKNNRTIFSN